MYDLDYLILRFWQCLSCSCKIQIYTVLQCHINTFIRMLDLGYLINPLLHFYVVLYLCYN